MPAEIERDEPERPEDHDDGGLAAAADAALDEAIGQLEEKLGTAPDDDEADLHVASAAGPPKKKKGEERSEDGDDEPEPDEEDDDEDSDDDELEDSGETDEDDEEEADEEAEDEDEDEIELHRAYTTLHDKLKVPASVLKSTPRAKLIAWAQRVDSEESGARETASSDEPGSERPTGTKETSGKRPIEGDADELRAALRAKLAERLGLDEDVIDETMMPFHDDVSSLRSELAELKEALKASENRAAAAQGQQTIDREVRRLERRYGSLGEKRKELIDEARTLAAGIQARGGQIDAREVFDKAARTLGLRKKRSDLAALRRNGGSSPPETIGNGRFGEINEDDGWSRSVDLALEGARTGSSRRADIARVMSRTRSRPKNQRSS